MILLIDNYDSFTFNIYQMLLELKQEVIIKRNDKIQINEIEALSPTHIILGPGPNSPKDSKICLEIIIHFKDSIPILGICLGHEAILYAHNIPIVNSKNILHGKTSRINHSEDGLFTNVPQGILVARYHSLCGKKEDILNLSNEFNITAFSDDDEVMSISHKKYSLFGVQFHPESIASEFGNKIMQNFINCNRLKIPVKTYLNKLTELENLNFSEAYDLMECISENDLNPSQIASLITSFKIKKPTSEEISAFAYLLIKKGAKFHIDKDLNTIDVVGTGGSAKKTFNVSTTVAIVLASMGLKVLKHGNRAVTSKSGSADLLKELGVNINMSLDNVQNCFEKLGIAFLFAPNIHSALKNVQNIRKELGFKSIFNLLGPISNPLKPNNQLIGVFNRKYTDILANALLKLGSKNAMVVSGMDGLDEFSLVEETQITRLENDNITTSIFSPFSFVKQVKYYDLRGGNAQDNARITIDILSGKEDPKSDLVCLNTGAALFLSKNALSIEEGFFKAKDFLKTKEALDFLENFKKFSCQC